MFHVLLIQEGGHQTQRQGRKRKVGSWQETSKWATHEYTKTIPMENKGNIDVTVGTREFVFTCLISCIGHNSHSYCCCGNIAYQGKVKPFSEVSAMQTCLNVECFILSSFYIKRREIRSKIDRQSKGEREEDEKQEEQIRTEAHTKSCEHMQCTNVVQQWKKKKKTIVQQNVQL